MDKIHRLVILLSVRVLGNPNEKIGEPVSLDDIVDGAAINHAHVATGTSVDLTATDARQHCLPISNQRGAEDILRSPPILLIDDLNPYQNNWTIRAQVTQKSDIKAWSTDRSDGKLFSVTLTDESGEIRATAFNTAADELFTRLEEGKVYYISGARIKLANKKFSQNNYELTLEITTQVQEVSLCLGLVPCYPLTPAVR
jgi:replication factor A1